MPDDIRIQITKNCPTCGGTGLRPPESIGGAPALGAGGRDLPCRACDGKKRVSEEIGLAQLSELIEAGA